MRRDSAVEDEPVMAVEGGGALSKYSLAVVCLLGLAAGGAAALALHYDGRGDVEAPSVVTESAGVEREAGAEGQSAAGLADAPGQAGDGETQGGGREYLDDIVGVTAVPDWKARGAGERAGANARVPSGRYAKASDGRGAPGGRGVAGHMVGGVKKTGRGVKKTGAVIGKTFGKVGGLFND